MTELEAVDRLQHDIDAWMGLPHTYFRRGGPTAPDAQWAWVMWSALQLRVGLGYNLPELASIRVLRVYQLFYLFGPRGGANFDVQAGYSGRSERVKAFVEGIGMNTCRISLYRWVNGQRRRIGQGRGVVGVLAQTSYGYAVENLETMPATAR